MVLDKRDNFLQTQAVIYFFETNQIATQDNTNAGNNSYEKIGINAKNIDPNPPETIPIIAAFLVIFVE